MTIQELFESEKLSLEFLEAQVDGNAYWDSVNSFIKYNWKRDVASLSVKQAAWVSRIVDDLTEIRIEGRHDRQVY